GLASLVRIGRLHAVLAEQSKDVGREPFRLGLLGGFATAFLLASLPVFGVFGDLAALCLFAAAQLVGLRALLCLPFLGLHAPASRFSSSARRRSSARAASLAARSASWRAFSSLRRACFSSPRRSFSRRFSSSARRRSSSARRRSVARAASRSAPLARRRSSAA